MSKYILIFLLFLSFSSVLTAKSNIESLRWRNVVNDQPDSWYGSTEAVRVAENVLLYQRSVGGWPKNTPMHKTLTRREKNDLQKLQSVGIGATTDNGATCMELLFLSKVYGKIQDVRYKNAFLKGVDYLIEAQYDNGGWPQFYPAKDGYDTHITYNDNSMVNIMNVMKAVAEKSDMYSITTDEATVLKAKIAFEKGVDIILKTQYKQNGELTVWCAQHDEKTFEPKKARSYELPSLSGGESVGIVLLLMRIDNPSPEIVNAVQSAVTWFEKTKIGGIRVENYINDYGVKDRRVVEDISAPYIWGRFYELTDNRPFFCDRDGIKKYSLAEIGHERRNGYSWYVNGPQRVLNEYEKWQQYVLSKDNRL
jgi:pectinesterase